jgi:molybdenum cofactor synthesis domain-containing protein
VTDVQLLDKTEVWIRGIALDQADLPAIAHAAARALGVAADRIFVTDVRDDLLVLDVLVPSLPLEAIAGRQQSLLDAIGAVEHVTLAPNATVHSNGVLGVIGASADQAARIVDEARLLDDRIRALASRRVAVVSTGTELLDGRVKDTNFEVIRDAFVAAGYEVESGGTVGDDARSIAGRVARLAGEGYGIIVTTGGIGAEDKDCTVDALTYVDPAVTTAVLASFEAGRGRHVRESIRIAMARVGASLAVALPGPTHEVRTAMVPLLDGLRANCSDRDILESVAEPLRALLRQHPQHRRA